MFLGRARLEALTENDVKLFQSRIIPIADGKESATFDEMAEFFVKLQEKDAGALALFPTNAEVAEFNDKVQFTLLRRNM
jgi:hypothetical protein